MKIQKSFSAQTSVLYLVPTPIGNFDDMTFRAIEVLKNADYIFAEDTRVTKVLLSHFAITTPLRSYHSFNEELQSEQILEMLNSGKNIALVSDAGLPCISDPGFLISRSAIESGYTVIALPGPNAALTALVASGLPSERFFFYGFLSHKKSQKEKELKKIADYTDTVIIYEAPHRIKETIELMNGIIPKREAVICRELTKKHEEYIRGTIEEIAASDFDYKGEIVIILKGADFTLVQETLLQKTIPEHYQYYIDNGFESKDAMKLVAKDRKISKSEVYKNIL